MESNFEAVWVSVRPAPLVTIDFGNGHKVIRTLQGNVATYICGADGTIVDLLPGIYTPGPYREQLAKLATLTKDLAKLPEPERATRLKAYHTQRFAALTKQVPANVAFAGKHGGGCFGTGGGQVGGLGGFGGMGIGGKGGFGGGSGAAFGGGNGGFGSAPAPTPPPVYTGIEGPLEAVLAGRPFVAASPKGGDLATRADLQFDVVVNETVRRRLVHERLATLDAVQPDQLKSWLFREVLKADLDDPKLGLGTVLNEGDPFGAEEH